MVACGAWAQSAIRDGVVWCLLWYRSLYGRGLVRGASWRVGPLLWAAWPWRLHRVLDAMWLCIESAVCVCIDYIGIGAQGRSTGSRTWTLHLLRFLTQDGTHTRSCVAQRISQPLIIFWSGSERQIAQATCADTDTYQCGQAARAGKGSRSAGASGDRRRQHPADLSCHLQPQVRGTVRRCA